MRHVDQSNPEKNIESHCQQSTVQWQLLIVVTVSAMYHLVKVI
jgi:hypothetical protein